MSVLTLKDVSYKYSGTKNLVLKYVNAEFSAGSLYTVIGRSGSGKTTLLSLIAGLDVCSNGQILYGEKSLNDIDRDSYRARDIGVVFQSYNLLTNTTPLKNVVLSMNISGSKEADKKAFAYALLERVGIDRETADRKILQLSGGEQQRVAIARALSHDPDVIIADEPTGNLDSDTEMEILDIFTGLAHHYGKCVIIVTHSKRITAIADGVYSMDAGKLSPMQARK